jgi:uncharacterized short protein YbdD (DUF466 family)
MKQNIDELARKERAEYARRWRKNNPDKVKAIQDRYWRNRAAKRAAGEVDDGK